MLNRHGSAGITIPLRLIWLVFMTVVLGVGTAGADEHGGGQSRPNILFIITDDQHYESFGFLEGKAITPRIVPDDANQD